MKNEKNMRTFNQAGAVIGAVLALAGCQSAHRTDTYDAIRREMASASKPVAAVNVDDSVAKALLPPVAELASQMPKARAALEERFNVNVNNASAQQFFHSLVEGTRYNMLVAPEISGSVTLSLKDVTLKEALDAARELYGYEYTMDGTKVYIRPLTMQTRMFRVNYLVGQRNGQSNLRVASTSVSDNLNQNAGGAGGTSLSPQGAQQGSSGQNQAQNQNQDGRNGRVDSANVSTTSRSDFWTDLRTSLQTIVGSTEGGRSVVINGQSGVVLVRAMPKELRDVEEFLRATKSAVERQVILEAKILEVELNESFQSGINWASFASFKGSHANRVSTGMVGPGTGLAPLPFEGGQPPVISNGIINASTGFSLANAAANGASMFALAFQTNNFAALLSFLESQGTVHVISSPRVAAVNNQKAVLKIGVDEFYVTGVTSTTNSTAAGSSTTPSVTLQPFFSGVVLDVTPQIDDAGNILLHVHPSVSQVSTVTKGINLGTSGNLTLPLPSSSTAEIDSMVRGQDGKVVAIGGLMRQAASGDTSQLPVAGKIPLLGELFKNKNRVSQKRELVVLIKPTIVEGGVDWSPDMQASESRVEWLDPRAAGMR
jgi:MSHA biogenesis protein MshL